jgi:hypothetical protein
MNEITSHEYWQEIESLCKQVFEECQEYQREPCDVLHETLDGHQWVIYTRYAFDVLKHSDNDGAAIEEMGAEAATKDGVMNWALLVYCAMHQDCIDRAEFDWNEIPEPLEVTP